jgi:hypothetical protein
LRYMPCSWTEQLLGLRGQGEFTRGEVANSLQLQVN